MPYKDKEKRREWLKQYRLTHKEYCKKYREKYREKNRERIREIGRNYYHRHKNEKKEIKCERNKQYRIEHKEYFKERNKQYRIAHKEYFQEYLKKYREEQKLKALQAIKNTAKDILKTTNQNFINKTPSQAKKITKKEFKNQIFKQIYEVLGTPEGWTRFCKLLNKQSAENIISKYEE